MPQVRGSVGAAFKFARALCPVYEDDGFPLPSPRWQYEALCRTIPANSIAPVFFPVKGFGPDKYTQAQQICRQCPVKADCLEAAIREEGREPHGMRGGLSPQRRHELWKDRQKHKAAQAENNKHHKGKSK